MNLRSTDLQAFIGLNQLKKVEEFGNRRNKNFFEYINCINELGEEQNNALKLKQRDGDFISNFCFPVINDNKENDSTKFN